MSSLSDDGTWDGEIPGTLHEEVADITMLAGELSSDLTALAAWLLCFASTDVAAELHFLYRKCRSLATATAVITLLDRLLANLEEAPPLLKTLLDDPEKDGFLLVELIDYRLEQTRSEQPNAAVAMPLITVRELLAQMDARERIRRARWESVQ